MHLRIRHEGTLVRRVVCPLATGRVSLFGDSQQLRQRASLAYAASPPQGPRDQNWRGAA